MTDMQLLRWHDKIIQKINEARMTKGKVPPGLYHALTIFVREMGLRDSFKKEN